MSISHRVTTLLAVISLAGAYAIASTGCAASVISKTHQTVQLQASQPAEVSVVENPGQADERVYGPMQTPAWVSLNKAKDYNVTYRSAGGAELSFEPGREFDFVSLLNIIALLGFLGDLYTGAILKYEEDAWLANFEENRVEPALPSMREGIIDEPTYLDDDDTGVDDTETDGTPGEPAEDAEDAESADDEEVAEEPTE